MNKRIRMIVAGCLAIGASLMVYGLLDMSISEENKYISTPQKEMENKHENIEQSEKKEDEYSNLLKETHKENTSKSEDSSTSVIGESEAKATVDSVSNKSVNIRERNTLTNTIEKSKKKTEEKQITLQSTKNEESKQQIEPDYEEKKEAENKESETNKVNNVINLRRIRVTWSYRIEDRIKYGSWQGREDKWNPDVYKLPDGAVEFSGFTIEYIE